MSKEGSDNSSGNVTGFVSTGHLPASGRVQELVDAAYESFAGHILILDEEVYRSASATNHTNRELADLLVLKSPKVIIKEVEIWAMP